MQTSRLAATMGSPLSPFLASLRRAGVTEASTVAVALSGGPDSLALAALTAHWQGAGWEGAKRSAPPAAAALIVDHGLRAESAAEAAGVAGVAERLGLEPHILRVEWAHGTPRVQDKMAAAREARYELLLEACARLDRRHLLVAHHADDQVETFLLRLLHASGVCGLGCMPLLSTALSGGGDVAVVRPLLSVRKAELEAYCEGAGLHYWVDPTNADPGFARNRLRSLLQREEEEERRGAWDAVGDVLRLQRACADAGAMQQAAVTTLLRQAVLLLVGAELPLSLAKAQQDVGQQPRPASSSGCSVGASRSSIDAGSCASSTVAMLGQRLDLQLKPAPRYALCSVPQLAAEAAEGSEEVCSATLACLLGTVSGLGHWGFNSSKVSRALTRALWGGRLAGKFTGGGCTVQPVPGSKGRLAVMAPLAQQAAVAEALRGALK